ncbi:Scr1 family TA system antitoxin-like transcriptional regulator [Streptomyces sp. BPTC-684]|uniref:Scr1 family TA system antitoxin-like transcriptional regulator n=1 Tax=Streptomyces sp. BPTC-684 TaxID=3043734 RepID=UPI0024B1E5A6|nr:Scr1 family TA system antitoxin-like transcriptional regulator [Streptomyces sp. BPTC-684]WHM40224.1 Scr1 family TA system antitoxin-like transcriptional regulator [Streptomyces sp. BPTC-684]
MTNLMGMVGVVDLEQASGEPRKRFAEELKSARELHPDRPTQTAVARWARTSKSTISRVESGTGHIPPDLPTTLDQIFNTDGLFKGLYEEIVAHSFPALYQRRMTLERNAIAISEWAQTVVPGLLQTHDYAQAILRKGDPARVTTRSQRLFGSG